jgi:3-hydroxyacyl-[acyl-carrier-protein] dehydratase
MTKTDVLPYIPQRPPFVMIDELLHADETLVRAAFTVPEGHLFTDNGVFGEPGLVEHMAQAAAAGTGYRARKEDKPAPVGFIGALKDLRIHTLPPVGARIVTEVHFLQQVLNAHLVKATVTLGTKEVASCEFKIFLQQ